MQVFPVLAWGSAGDNIVRYAFEQLKVQFDDQSIMNNTALCRGNKK
jgi:hypothetical protein